MNPTKQKRIYTNPSQTLPKIGGNIFSLILGNQYCTDTKTRQSYHMSSPQCTQSKHGRHIFSRTFRSIT